MAKEKIHQVVDPVTAKPRLRAWNRIRAIRIKDGLGHVNAYDGHADWKATVIDALTDIKHLCEMKDIDFDACLSQASMHFMFESKDTTNATVSPEAKRQTPKHQTKHTKTTS